MNGDEMEGLETFRRRARSFIAEQLKEIPPLDIQRSINRSLPDDEELAGVERDREIQRSFFDAGFAGLCVPRSYGGQGLTLEYQRAFNEEIAGHEYPSRLQAPTFTPCLAVILEFGTDAQKREHVPRILKGEEIWMQFLSEPSGGSDVAGALTTAVRDGDEWVLNGSKMWTTGAWWSDWALCLARTNWDVPKHRGLTVFMVPIDARGVEVHRIEMLSGSREFCQEFLTDVRVPDSCRIGDVDDGWTVGVRWMFHERMLYSSPYVTFPGGAVPAFTGESLLGLAERTGRLDDPRARDLVAQAWVLTVVSRELQQRISAGIARGQFSDQAAAIARLFGGVTSARTRTLAFELSGASGAVWPEGDDTANEYAMDFLLRQVSSIGGGTTEMARNVIAERVLGMPRERSGDRDVAFREVPRGPVPGR